MAPDLLEVRSCCFSFSPLGAFRSSSERHPTVSYHAPGDSDRQEDYPRTLSVGRIASDNDQCVRDIAAYEESLAMRRRLARVDPSNAQWRHDEACPDKASVNYGRDD